MYDYGIFISWTFILFFSFVSLLFSPFLYLPSLLNPNAQDSLSLFFFPFVPYLVAYFPHDLSNHLFSIPSALTLSYFSSLLCATIYFLLFSFFFLSFPVSSLLMLPQFFFFSPILPYYSLSSPSYSCSPLLTSFTSCSAAASFFSSYSNLSPFLHICNHHTFSTSFSLLPFLPFPSPPFPIPKSNNSN